MADPSGSTSTMEAPVTTNGGSTIQLAQLDDLKARATLKYSVKDYDAAAELYSEATELQAELNGEMSPSNAILLYQYGKCLHHVAVKNSDVLGSKVAGEKREAGASRSKGKKKGAKAAARESSDQANGDATASSKVEEEVITKVVEEKDGPMDAAKDSKSQSKPYFQFTGDGNFDDSGDEQDWVDGDDEGAEAEEDEEDDFANAYEALDIARVLLLRRIEEEHASGGKGKGIEDSPTIKHLKGDLADTLDLQADISLEGERFPNAVTDLKEVLALKQDLVPFEDSQIAEAHYKLSLALEFSSVTQEKDEGGEATDGEQGHVDDAMREEAAKHMELAIASCNLRIEKEIAKLAAQLATPSTGDKSQVTQAQIDEVKDMVKDMEHRLMELRQSPISINDPTSTGTLDGSFPLSGVLGSILGESPAAQKARLEGASKEANDLTSLVKRKKTSNAPSPQPSADGSAKTNGKRKVDFDEETVEVGTGKKAKLEDGEE